MIKSNLKDILDARRIPIRVFSARIDYRFETVRKLYHSDLTRIPAELIDRCCRELNCSVGTLLTFVEDDLADLVREKAPATKAEDSEMNA